MVANLDKRSDALVWAAVRVLGHLDPRRSDLEELWNQFPRDSEFVDRILDGIRTAKVAEIANRNLQICRDASALAEGLAAALQQHVDERKRKREARLPLLRHAVTRAADLGGRLIKGLAFRRFYPDPAIRHLGDADVHFDQLATAIDFLKALRSEGWFWDPREMPWVKWTDAHVPYGQWAVIFPLDDQTAARVDVHIGAFSVGHLGLLPLIEFERVRLEGLDVQCLGSGNSIALIAAHAMGDYFLSMKDVNDVSMIVRNGPIDWSSVLELCRGPGVLKPALQLLRWAAYLYPDVAVPLSNVKGPLSPTAPSRLDRAFAMARLTLLQERASGSILHGMRRMPRAIHYYLANLTPRIGGTGTVPTRRRRTRWNCWRMVPQQVWENLVPLPSLPQQLIAKREDLTDRLHLYSTQGGCAVQLDHNDIFIPTIWGKLSEQSIILADALSHGVASSAS